MNEVFVEAQSYETISTLDEPVWDTLKRDLLAIVRKLAVVVCPPLGHEQELRDWDLWGPLILSLILALILSTNAGSSQHGLVFSAVFVLVWVGSAVVTLNAKFLGSTISFFQTVCVMGYCLAPVCVAALLALVIPWAALKIVIALAMWVWACWAALRFIRGSVPSERELLVVYPVALIFFFISWMVMAGI